MVKVDETKRLFLVGLLLDLSALFSCDQGLVLKQ